ncbi:MAG: RNA methyltransferase [Desulfotalea sp.]
MAKLKQSYTNEGFFGIGIVNNTNQLNIGTLWRSAFIMGASFIFTVDKKYKHQSSDVTKSWTKIPLFHYKDIIDLKDNLPFSTRLVGVELVENATPLAEFEHPDRATYILGNEQIGLSNKILDECESIIKLPGNFSLNVAVTGSIVLYDRTTKISRELPR